MKKEKDFIVEIEDNQEEFITKKETNRIWKILYICRSISSIWNSCWYIN